MAKVKYKTGDLRVVIEQSTKSSELGTKYEWQAKVERYTKQSRFAIFLDDPWQLWWIWALDHYDRASIDKVRMFEWGATREEAEAKACDLIAGVRDYVPVPKQRGSIVTEADCAWSSLSRIRIQDVIRR